MAFRERQKFVSSGAAAIVGEQYKVNPETGVAQLEQVKYSGDLLPDAKMTDLALQLKAGVDLRSVDTKVIKGSKEKQALAALSVEEVKSDKKEGE